jgi:hypothetical protein
LLCPRAPTNLNPALGSMNMGYIYPTLPGIELTIVCLLSVELFILGVQANKLHFCNLEMILNKTGYSHTMENKKFFFSFFNMGTG